MGQSRRKKKGSDATDSEDDQDFAASKIQAVWKGKQERRAVRELEEQLRLEEKEAEAMLDAHWLYTKEVMQVRRRLYLLFEEPQSSFYAVLVSVGILGTIFFSIACFILETMPQLRDEDGQVRDGIWSVIEIVSTLIFTAEYLIRLWVCDATHEQTYVGFLRNRMNVLDILAISPFYIQTVLKAIGGGNFQGQMLRVLRVIRLARIMKLGKYSAGMQLMAEALRRSLQALWVLLFLISIGVVLFSSLLFHLEKIACPMRAHMSATELKEYETECCCGQRMSEKYGLCCDEHDSALDFPSIPHACWWSVVTMTTVGFGDVYPRTVQGRAVGVCAMLAGILIIALPVAIVGRKFQDVYEEYQSATARPLAGEGVALILKGKGTSPDRFPPPVAPMSLVALQMRRMNVYRDAQKKDSASGELLEELRLLAAQIDSAEELAKGTSRLEMLETYRQCEVYQRFDRLFEATVERRAQNDAQMLLRASRGIDLARSATGDLARSATDSLKQA